MLLGLAPPAGAQRAPRDTVDVGSSDRVRLRVDGRRGWVVGRLDAVGDDSVALLPCSRCTPAAFPREAVRVVQWSTGPSRGIELLTGLAGAVVGARIGQSLARHRPKCAGNCAEDNERLAFVGGAVVGAGAGLTLGTWLGRERWVPARFRGHRPPSGG
jgi:hypothetical protein